MKRTFAIFILLFATLVANARTNDADALKLKDIAEKSASIKTLSCRFRQVQESPLLKTPEISTGLLQFKSGGTLVWKYETPKLFQLSILEDRIVMTSDRGTRAMTLSENPMMEQVRDFFIGLVSGSGLQSENGHFECTLKEESGACVVTMIPKARQTARIFSRMELSFTGPEYLVGSVTLFAAKGGKTTIVFSDHIVTR